MVECEKCGKSVALFWTGSYGIFNIVCEDCLNKLKMDKYDVK